MLSYQTPSDLHDKVSGYILLRSFVIPAYVLYASYLVSPVNKKKKRLLGEREDNPVVASMAKFG
jgi:hypothetical protein